ncbi:DUF1090 family protein [Campylobacter sp. TTU-622]|uniref:DUF1090 family protein n=1 Tax=Campylobacter sp. TTU-622 TaxID=2800583 RepID=UPI00190570A6|nr:DUF1090 family protein [Campylobacter sp. TTU-622]MBK1973230.1 DUF1090 family protein [Campylobacter sp. TTU-622]
MRKVLVFLFVFCGLLFANECDKKIERINKEIAFAKANGNTGKISRLELALKEVQSDCIKDPLFYDKKLEAKKLKEQEIEKIEQQLKELNNQKDYLSKAEYKAKKRALKEQKDKIKKEIEKYIDDL